MKKVLLSIHSYACYVLAAGLLTRLCYLLYTERAPFSDNFIQAICALLAVSLFLLHALHVRDFREDEI